MVAPVALVYLAWLTVSGESNFASHGAGHALLFTTTGIVTVIPLVCFGAAATRIPLVSMGLLQYITPIVQFSIGVFVYGEAMPASRWAGFGLVWIALVIFTVEALNHHRRQLALAAHASAMWTVVRWSGRPRRRRRPRGRRAPDLRGLRRGATWPRSPGR